MFDVAYEEDLRRIPKDVEGFGDSEQSYCSLVGSKRFCQRGRLQLPNPEKVSAVPREYEFFVSIFFKFQVVSNCKTL